MSFCSYCKKEGRLAAKGLCGTCYARYQRNGTAEYVRPNRCFGVTQCSHCESTDGPFVKSLCRACYQRQYANGAPDLRRTRHLCEVRGCDDIVTSHGLCARHMQRMRRHGSVDAGRPDGWGAKRKHPMYEAWRGMRRGARTSGGCDPRWADFWCFLDDMGERPAPNSRLYRVDPSKPFAKDNCEWRASVLDIGSRATKAEYQRVYRAKRPGVHSRLSRKKLYGITDDWYERTLESQGGVCAICKGSETQRHNTTREIISLAVDHEEIDGKIILRGILCKACNTSIGALDHDADRLRAAIAYLERHAKIDTSGD